jgi:hypothetical protein
MHCVTMSLPASLLSQQAEMLTYQGCSVKQRRARLMLCMLRCVQHAPLADSSEKFPVVIFSHGIGGTRNSYSGMCSELGSAVTDSLLSEPWTWRLLACRFICCGHITKHGCACYPT